MTFYDVSWRRSPILIARVTVLALAIISGLGWWRTGALGVVLVAVAMAEKDWAEGRLRQNVFLGAAWLCSILVFCSFLAEGKKLFGLEFAGTALGTALAISPLARGSFKDKPIFWRLLILAWLCFGTGELLRGSYVYDNAKVFWVGLAGALGTILVLLCGFRLPDICNQGLITVLLVIMGLPLVDHFIRPMPQIREPITDFERYYSYEGARKDPDAAVAWAHYSIVKWWDYQRKAFYRDGPDELPIRFRPNTRTKLYDSEICINSLGFRGREFSRQKTNTYRIVALGESTTFGISLTADHRPWPELLEELIHERLKGDKPVEVINAGFPGRTLPQNVYRLKHELLAVEPDMIISYHGFNGFHMLDSAIPAASGPPGPQYVRRPLRLLAAVEYHVKLSLYKKNRMASTSQAGDFTRSMDTSYAEAYRELIRTAQTNHIKLVLANYSMAVNVDSDPDVIEFYRGPFPAVLAQIRANQTHSAMVDTLATESPAICFVDTHPKMDGNHHNFVDLMHFNKQGDQQMAETFFAATRPILEQELGVMAEAKQGP